MGWQWTPTSMTLLSTSGLSLAIVVVLFRRRAIPGGATLVLLMLAVAEWCLVAGLEAAVVPLSLKILFSKLEYVGSGSVAVLFLLFASRYSGRNAWLSRPRIAALWLMPLASVTLTASNEWHGLVWTGFSPAPPGTNALIYHHGIGFFVIIAAIYIYLLIASALLVITAVRPPIVQRRQTITLLIATAFPWISGILYAANVTPISGLNLTPVSFVATGVVLACGIVPLRLFDLVPVARDSLIEGMSDGILVIDVQRRVVDVNPAARRLLNLPSDVIGADVHRALSPWPQIASQCGSEQERHLELVLSENPLRYVDVRFAPLRKGTHAAAGCLIVVRDITKRYRAETELQNANQRLQDQLHQIERLQEELREQSIRDTVTGLFNRRHLADTFPRILNRAIKDRTPVSVVMLDIDHFKQVNDRYGHRTGDALLTALGSLLAEQTRASDLACRYGGEEFVLIFPATPLDVARERAEELRRAFRALDVPPLDRDALPTLSAGVAVFPNHGSSQDEILHAADQALYLAKEAGRDCVRSAPDRPPRTIPENPLLP